MRVASVPGDIARTNRCRGCTEARCHAVPLERLTPVVSVIAELHRSRRMPPQFADRERAVQVRSRRLPATLMYVAVARQRCVGDTVSVTMC